jgi:hypothetical protein
MLSTLEHIRLIQVASITDHNRALLALVAENLKTWRSAINSSFLAALLDLFHAR